MLLKTQPGNPAGFPLTVSTVADLVVGCRIYAVYYQPCWRTLILSNTRHTDFEFTTIHSS